jgi:hypothetical protein
MRIGAVVGQVMRRKITIRMGTRALSQRFFRKTPADSPPDGWGKMLGRPTAHHKIGPCIALPPKNNYLVAALKPKALHPMGMKEKTAPVGAVLESPLYPSPKNILPMNNFEKVKHYLMELNYEITHEDVQEELVVIRKEDEGIKNMVIDCEDPILIIEQFLFEVKDGSAELFRSLLQKNREIVHGAFALDESGTKVLFRDTLQLDTLDLEELEASLTSLTLLLNEYYEQILEFAH